MAFKGHIEPSLTLVFFGEPLCMRVSDGKYKTSILADQLYLIISVYWIHDEKGPIRLK